MPNNDIFERIKKGENQYLEFKESFRINRFGKIDKKLPIKIVREICGFLNSTGGELVIGVEDNGHIVGISRDTSSFSRSNYNKGKDLLLITITDLIRQNFGINAGNKIKPYFLEESTSKLEILIIKIEKSEKPFIFQKKEFPIRLNNQTIKLDKDEILEYFRENYAFQGSKRELELYLLKLMGYKRILCPLIKKKHFRYCPLLLNFGVISISWIVYIPIDYQKSLFLLSVFLFFLGLISSNFAYDFAKILIKDKKQKDLRSEIEKLKIPTVDQSIIKKFILVSLFFYMVCFYNLYSISKNDPFKIPWFVIFVLAYLVGAMAYYILIKSISKIDSGTGIF